MVDNIVFVGFVEFEGIYVGVLEFFFWLGYCVIFDNFDFGFCKVDVWV